MDINEALEIVLSLARQNIIDEHDDIDEHNRQVEACNVVEASLYFGRRTTDSD